MGLLTFLRKLSSKQVELITRTVGGAIPGGRTTMLFGRDNRNVCLCEREEIQRETWMLRVR